MEQKFQCDRCGNFFIKQDITYIPCEGLFCTKCTDVIYTQIWDEFDEKMRGQELEDEFPYTY